MKILAVLTFVCATLAAGQAWAVPILGVVDQNNSANVTVEDATITIENTSAVGYQTVITTFGFDALNDIFGLINVTGTQQNGNWIFNTDQSPNVNGNSNTYEFGVTSANNINNGNHTGSNAINSGSTNVGIVNGGTGNFTFGIMNSDGTTTLTPLGEVSAYFVRFQRTGLDGEGSDSGTCSSGCGGPTPPTPVSEPPTLAILGIGLLGAGFARRMRLKKTLS